MDWKITPIAVAAVMGLAAPAPTPALADAREALGAMNDAVGIICAFADCRGNQRAAPQPQRQPRNVSRGGDRVRQASPAVSAADQQRIAAERQQNIGVQSALTGFGFDTGGVDGRLGPRSRAAISAYQGYMGYPTTGYLDDYQRGALMDYYGRLQAGAGNQYPQVVAAEGTKGLLRAFKDPGYASRYPAPGDSLPDYAGGPANPYPQQSPYPQQPTADPQVPREPQGGVISQASDAPVMLPPIEFVGAATSMAERCELVDLTTQTNQGPIRVSNMSDPAQALSEQFCEARSYAISVSQNMSANARASEDQLVTSCQQIATSMTPVKAALAGETPEAVAAKAAAVNGQIGLQDASAAATYGQICLGLGYRRDDADMALAAGLLLVGAGYMPFGEMLGHHLREGFGAAPSNGAALPWYNAALTALDANASPAFLPSKTSERAGVIRAAIESGQIRANGPAPLPGLVPVSAPLPAGQVIAK